MLYSGLWAGQTLVFSRCRPPSRLGLRPEMLSSLIHIRNRRKACIEEEKFQPTEQSSDPSLQFCFHLRLAEGPGGPSSPGPAEAGCRFRSSTPPRAGSKCVPHVGKVRIWAWVQQGLKSPLPKCDVNKLSGRGAAWPDKGYLSGCYAACRRTV